MSYNLVISGLARVSLPLSQPGPGPARPRPALTELIMFV